MGHNDVLRTSSLNEAEQIIETIGSVLNEVDRARRVCVDITGFMRPQILFVLRYFHALGFKNFEMIYTEPLHYARKEDTDFALADVSEVRQVSGFEGAHNLDMSSGINLLKCFLYPLTFIIRGEKEIPASPFKTESPLRIQKVG